MSVSVTTHVKQRLFFLLSSAILLSYSSFVFSGYKAFLDPRSMAMGGTGVAASTKFNASAHNPALIAFNKGEKPDKIYASVSTGIRELYKETLTKDILEYQNSSAEEDFINAVIGSDLPEARIQGARLKSLLEDKNYSSYRSDEMKSFSLLVDTLPVTINAFFREELRQMSVFVNKDSDTIDLALDLLEKQDGNTSRIADFINSSIETTHFNLTEFGVTVATTNVIDYNMPISWGFTPKLIQFSSSYISRKINDYDVNNPDTLLVRSDKNLEWNLDVGFAMLFTDDFLREEFGLDGWWLEGEWVFAFSGMNLFPTDINHFTPRRFDPTFPGGKASMQALYQVGLAYYRETYMWTFDIELTEDKVYEGFEGNSRFISVGGEYYWRDDFHLRGGVRYNASATDKGAKEKTTLHTGFMYQPHGLSIEGGMMISDVEIGGTIGFGYAF